MNKFYQFIIRLRSAFIFSSQKRKNFRNKHLNPNLINGLGNKIIIIKDGQEFDYSYRKIDNLNIFIQGNNNLIKIEYPCNIFNSRIHIRGNNNTVNIKKCHPTGFRNASFEMGSIADNRKIIIDEGFSCGGVEIVNNISGNSVEIGKDCMFSDEIHLRADDGHVIYNDANAIANNSTYLKIGNHVWVSRRSYIGKNVEIADNCIIGFGAIVTKSQKEKNSIIAGNPAKIIKRNISWVRYNHNEIITKKEELCNHE